MSFSLQIEGYLCCVFLFLSADDDREKQWVCSVLPTRIAVLQGETKRFKRIYRIERFH